MKRAKRWAFGGKYSISTGYFWQLSDCLRSVWGHSAHFRFLTTLYLENVRPYSKTDGNMGAVGKHSICRAFCVQDWSEVIPRSGKVTNRQTSYHTCQYCVRYRSYSLRINYFSAWDMQMCITPTVIQCERSFLWTINATYCWFSGNLSFW